MSEASDGGDGRAARVIAVDWSGSKDAGRQRAAIWVAEAAAGELVGLRSGAELAPRGTGLLARDEVVRWLVAEARGDARLIVGLDFGFSLPASYLRARRCTAPELWHLLAEEALTERMREAGLHAWMNDPEPPFWCRKQPAASEHDPFRQTEHELRAQGLSPASTFKLVGPGQVGRSSLTGMQALHALSRAGFGVWPFTPCPHHVLVEVYPRACIRWVAGAVPTNTDARRQTVVEAAEARGLSFGPHRVQAVQSTDALDAAVSAMVMSECLSALSSLDAEPAYGLEGRVWLPPEAETGRATR